MKKFFARFFGRLARSLEEKQELINKPEEVLNPITENKVVFLFPTTEEIEQGSKPKPEESFINLGFNKKSRKEPDKKIEKINGIKTNSVKGIVIHGPKDIRDVMELMEVPIVSLSKNRTAPIIYESPDGSAKVKITHHSGHYLASIYDWDIILFRGTPVNV